MPFLSDKKKRVARLGYIAVFAYCVSELIPALPIFWRILTDDGHGVYTAPEKIDPAPVLNEPWRAPPE